jgi:hypothetical protein
MLKEPKIVLTCALRDVSSQSRKLKVVTEFDKKGEHGCGVSRMFSGTTAHKGALAAGA